MAEKIQPKEEFKKAFRGKRDTARRKRKHFFKNSNCVLREIKDTIFMKECDTRGKK